jgi:hypothetical protein
MKTGAEDIDRKRSLRIDLLYTRKTNLYTYYGDGRCSLLPKKLSFRLPNGE